MEKPAASIGEIPCWEYFAEFRHTDGRCYCKSCAAGLETHGVGSDL